MVNRDKVENYILDMDLPYEELEDGIWIIYENEYNRDEKLVVSYDEEILHFRMKVMDIPKNEKVHCELFRKLLQQNATGLTHGSFAIENDYIVLTDSLQTENLDFNEFQASVEALFLGIIENYNELDQFVDKEQKETVK